jgi:hypothetical protein
LQEAVTQVLDARGRNAQRPDSAGLRTHSTREESFEFFFGGYSERVAGEAESVEICRISVDLHQQRPGLFTVPFPDAELSKYFAPVRALICIYQEARMAIGRRGESENLLHRQCPLS